MTSSPSLTMIADEIAEAWRSAKLADEDERRFLRTLHDPKTNAVLLLDDQCFERPDFTASQWEEVLECLRDEFPDTNVCDECYAPACGTYGSENVPLCGNCRDDGGWCSCGDKVKECPDCCVSDADE